MTKEGNTISTNAWLVSFGDLLTLLLCFFLSIIALSPISPFRGSLSQRKESLERSSPAVPEAGTAIAESSVDGGPGSLVRFGLSAVDFEENALTENAGARLEAALPYLTAPLVVEVCEERAGSGQSSAPQRALMLRRQLVNFGFTPEAVSVRLTGGNCAGLTGQTAEGAGMVAAVTARREIGVNG